MKFLIPFFTFFILLFQTSVASEIRYLARSPRALLMGDAFTALADDEYTLFYNPAALGRHGDFSISPLNPTVGVTNALDEIDRFKNFPKGQASKIQERLLGFPVYVKLGLTPTVKLGNFALSGLFNNTTSLVLHNKVYPEMNIDYRYDKGFVAGYAFTIGGGQTGTKNGKKKFRPGYRVSLGASVKHISREGLNGQFDLFGTKLLNVIENGASEINEIKQQLGYSTGSAWGFDFGMDYELIRKNFVMTTSFSILDAAGTRFKKEEGTRDIAEQEMIINWGTLFGQRFGPFFSYNLTFDLHPLTDSIDFARKVHLGAEINVLMFSVLFGMSEGYPSYGLGLDLAPFKLLAGFYSVELGTNYKQEEGKRAFISLNLLDFSF